MAETTTNSSAALTAEAAPSNTRHESPLEAVASYCAVIVVGLFILTFIFQNFLIPSGSMENTLLVGDHVLVDRINLAPPRTGRPLCATAMCTVATSSSS